MASSSPTCPQLDGSIDGTSMFRVMEGSGDVLVHTGKCLQSFIVFLEEHKKSPKPSGKKRPLFVFTPQSGAVWSEVRGGFKWNSD